MRYACLVCVFFFINLIMCRPIKAENYLVDGQSVTREFVLRMNYGNKLLNEGKYDEALPVVKELLQQSPNLASLHWSYAKILYHKGDFQNSYREGKKATKLMPSKGDFYITLGNAALKLGKKKESVAALQTYLRLKPRSAMAANVRSFVATVQKQISEDAKETIKSPPGTYLAEATVDGVTHWTEEKMPLKVCINKGTKITIFKPAYLDVLKSAFQQWQTRTASLVRFKFVQDPQAADIDCLWTSSNKLSSIEGAHTRYRDSELGRLKATITISTNRKGQPVQERELLSIALHEIGHALGINGHSSNPDDIMFLSVDKTKVELSKQDVETLVQLYKLKPGLLNVSQ